VVTRTSSKTCRRRGRRSARVARRPLDAPSRCRETGRRGAGRGRGRVAVQLAVVAPCRV